MLESNLGGACCLVPPGFLDHHANLYWISPVLEGFFGSLVFKGGGGVPSNLVKAQSERHSSCRTFLPPVLFFCVIGLRSMLACFVGHFDFHGANFRCLSPVLDVCI